jgi:hypothetical protein
MTEHVVWKLTETDLVWTACLKRSGRTIVLRKEGGDFWISSFDMKKGREPGLISFRQTDFSAVISFQARSLKEAKWKALNSMAETIMAGIKSLKTDLLAMGVPNDILP